MSDKLTDADLEDFQEWKRERDESRRKRGKYWLTLEGRAKLKEVFDDPNDSAAVRPLLDALEEAESKLKIAVEFLSEAYEPVSSDMRTQWDEEVDEFLAKLTVEGE